MSFKGEIEAVCPNNCESFRAEVWSFIHGEESPQLRMALLARECNLIVCPSCEAIFFPPEPYVYFESRAEILAFVFPETYRPREAYWREKMNSDFKAMKENLGAMIPVDVEPGIFFGIEDLALLLEGEDYRGEEREVMECIAQGLGLFLYRVSPQYARRNKVPGSLPYVLAGGSQATRESVIHGLQAVLAANDQLRAYQEFLEILKSSASHKLPPASKIRPA